METMKVTKLYVFVVVVVVVVVCASFVLLVNNKKSQRSGIHTIAKCYCWQ